MAELVLLDRFNWTVFTKLNTKTEQQAFLNSNLYAIAQSKFENCMPVGYLTGNQAVGMAVYCNWGNYVWISHIMIDAKFQNQSHGTEFLTLLIKKIKQSSKSSEIRVGVKAENLDALLFFQKNGFDLLEETNDGETVLAMRL